MSRRALARRGGAVQGGELAAHVARSEPWAWAAESKNKWGPKGWRWLHLVAIRYPLAPTRADAMVAFIRLWNFLTNLPCSECREHAIVYFSRHPPDLSNGEAFQTWAWRFHNSVNSRLRKPLVSHEAYVESFARDIRMASSERRGVPS